MFNSVCLVRQIACGAIALFLLATAASAVTFDYTDGYSDATVYQNAYNATDGTVIVQDANGNDVAITVDTDLSNVTISTANDTPVDPSGNTQYLVPDLDQGSAEIVYHFAAPEGETFTSFGIDRVQMAAVKRWQNTDGAVVLSYKLDVNDSYTVLKDVPAPTEGGSTEYNQFDSDVDAWDDPTFNEFTAAGSTDFYLRVQLQRDGNTVTSQLQYLKVSGETIPEPTSAALLVLLGTGLIASSRFRRN